METREVTQVLVYKLILNPIREKGDVAELAAMSYDGEKLNEFMDFLKESQQYKDGGFTKSFRKGSHLEMYNPWLGQKFGIFKEWVNEEDLKQFREIHSNIPFVE